LSVEREVRRMMGTVASKSHIDVAGTGQFREAIAKEKRIAMSHDPAKFDSLRIARSNPNSM
jgi:hypothetical protein